MQLGADTLGLVDMLAQCLFACMQMQTHAR